MTFKDDLREAYRTGKMTYTYSVALDWLLKKASQGYRMVPVDSCMQDTKLMDTTIVVLCKQLDLSIEPYWETKAIRLVDIEEPGRKK